MDSRCVEFSNIAIGIVLAYGVVYYPNMFVGVYLIVGLVYISTTSVCTMACSNEDMTMTTFVCGCSKGTVRTATVLCP